MPILPEEPEGCMGKLEMNTTKPLAKWIVVIGCSEAFTMFLRVKRFGTPGLGDVKTYPAFYNFYTARSWGISCPAARAAVLRDLAV
jgi:hypothetical protein